MRHNRAGEFYKCFWDCHDKNFDRGKETANKRNIFDDKFQGDMGIIVKWTK